MSQQIMPRAGRLPVEGELSSLASAGRLGRLGKRPGNVVQTEGSTWAGIRRRIDGWTAIDGDGQSGMVSLVVTKWVSAG